MNRRATILLAGLLVCWLVLFLINRPPTIESRHSAEGEPSMVSPHWEDIAREEAAYERETQARIEELTRLQRQRQAQQDLEDKTRDYRTRLQVARADGWADFISSTWLEYQTLREEAAHSTSKTAECTICDGTGSMDFCFLCNDSGKCVTCMGAGKTAYGEICPTCRGDGKCFLCMGSGRMACLFCDDGVVYLNLPPPPGQMPLQLAAMSPPAVAPVRLTAPIGPVSAQTAAMATVPAAKPAETFVTDPSIREPILLGILLVLASALIVPRLAPALGNYLNAHSNPWDSLSEEARAADQEFCEFLRSLRRNVGEDGNLSAGATEAEKRQAIERFFEIATERVEPIRNLFAALSRVPGEAARQRMLADLCGEVRSFWGLCDAPELRPIGQVAMGLEGLLRQVAQDSSRLTPSVLRTGAAAIIQLEKFAARRLTVDWQPGCIPHFLVVDDDPISRLAVSSPLKKVFSQPDLAENGEAALKLAAAKAYDVIFLDVQMPGMDGFEVCSKIHETKINEKTPVVFVTSHHDFEWRSGSADPGGHDLIGKPFEPLEITVKALTLVCRGGGPRRQNPKPHPPISIKEASKRQTPKTLVGGAVPEDPASSAETVPGFEILTPEEPANGSRREQRPTVRALCDASPQISVEDLARTFLAETPVAVRSLREKVRELWEEDTPSSRDEWLANLYIDVHTLAQNASLAKLNSISNVAAAVERLFAKLYEEPTLASRPVLETGSAALELIGEMCLRPAEDTPPKPSLRILVVDDDPISCRAMSNSLQLRFGKPECAQSAEAAVALAARRTYDLIFMDVRMPSMDGFMACSVIRKTAANGSTPVVFVTGLADLESQERCSVTGGNAFISKPVFPAQIALAALTFSLRGRLPFTDGVNRPESKEHPTPCPAPSALPCVH